MQFLRTPEICFENIVDYNFAPHYKNVDDGEGGKLRVHYVAARPDRFSRDVTANTGLPTGDAGASEEFLQWQKFSQEIPGFPTGAIINGGCTTELSPEIIDAYNAPYPDESYKEGARQFPLLVPTSSDDPEHQANVDAWKILATFETPWLTAFSDSDPIIKGGEKVFQKTIPGARNQAHTTIENGGHFLQEDAGEKLSTVAAQFIKENPLP